MALVRVEQFYPFAEEPLKQLLNRYRKAGMGLGPGRIAEHGRLDVHGAAAARRWAWPWSTSAATPAPARRRARSTVHVREQKELVEAALHSPAPYLVRRRANRCGSPTARSPRRRPWLPLAPRRGRGAGGDGAMVCIATPWQQPCKAFAPAFELKRVGPGSSCFALQPPHQPCKEPRPGTVHGMRVANVQSRTQQ